MDHNWTPRLLPKGAFRTALPERVIVFDGVCNLCTGWVKFVIRHDPAGHFTFVSAQSDLGQELMLACAVDPADYNSNIYIENGTAYLKLDTVIEIVRHFGGAWPMVAALKILPRPVRNWFYDRIARNRYRLFGKKQSCLIPTPDLKHRFLEKL